MPESNTSTEFEGSLSNEPKRIEEGVASVESEKSIDSPGRAAPPPAPAGPQPLPAVQLWTIVAAVSLAGFIYSMDVAIITTVSYHHSSLKMRATDFLKGYSRYYDSFQDYQRYRLVRKCVPYHIVCTNIQFSLHIYKS